MNATIAATEATATTTATAAAANAAAAAAAAVCGWTRQHEQVKSRFRKCV
jgi:hypothetical protein